MLATLERLLGQKKIPFHRVQRRIRYTCLLFYFVNTHEAFIRCFPHIVNLACKAVLGVLTELKYIDETQEGYEEYDLNTFSRDCIALIRSMVTAVHFNISLKLLHY
jgi:hypothetical protein